MKQVVSLSIFIGIIIIALFGFINSPTALLLGFIFSLFFKSSFDKLIHNSIQILLKISIIGLGFGMYLKDTIETSSDGLGLTFFSILFTVGLGFLLTRLLKIDKNLGHLITSGTSICGGSAIAAISPVIRANSKTISVALGVVFTLNAIALFVFPLLGHLLNLNQHQFGLWCAIAIHDTSSVVGAALGYGDEALRIATTVKLSRTLWIVPLSVISMFIFKTKGERIKIPYFILLFIIAITINSYNFLPEIATQSIVTISKKLLIVTLFLVGSTISIKDLISTGYKPILLAFSLWVFIAIFSLIYITF
ncbi:putative sulfate exporter family transporter [Cellulophaga sp. HaHaR_3_176]|uniref:YeiH family protein n=1 Tax=Cellulophaga sp. HaHaR_3_176 TaxID=1942464 RepID=UPI001C1F2E52|nr:putative sulfate exporter family transporter [Cellulophaga sp. HaHaR_3_176]QWX85328.1 putative sulfate exporter family transporter [Cellulophaga sp. HaHaR_3_176]